MKAVRVVVVVVLAIVLPVGKASSGAASPAQSLASTATGARTLWEGLAIVVNKKNPIDSLTLWQLRQIFFGERTWWLNRRRVTLVAMPRGTAEQQTMLRVIYQMDDRDLEKHFLWSMFRGEFFTFPATLQTARDVRKFVSNTPGAVAYLRESDVDNSVKVVRVNGLRPGDDGYPLRLRTRSAAGFAETTARP